MHGVELIEAVIERVTKVRLAGALLRGDEPRPVPPPALATLTFPDGKPLSPALKRWLAFDAGWLGWFADPAKPKFAPRTLGTYARDEYAMEWGYTALEPRFPGACYGLPFGSDSRRLLYVGEPDSTGEYPVLLLDTDDVPYIGVEYPGIDVYLAIHSGVLDVPSATYGDLIKHRRYGARMKEHAERYFDGTPGKEIFELAPQESLEQAFEQGLEDPTSAAWANPAAKKPAAKKKPAAATKKKPAAAAKKKPAKKPARRRS